MNIKNKKQAIKIVVNIMAKWKITMQDFLNEYRSLNRRDSNGKKEEQN